MTKQSFGLGFARPLTVLAVFVSIPGVATAQEVDNSGFRAEMFDPVPTQHTGVLNLRRPAVLQHLSVGGGIFAHYVENPVSTVDVPDLEVGGTAIDRQITTEVGIGLGLFDVAQLSLAAPVFSAQWGRGLPDAEEGGFPFGDTRASLDLLVVDPERANGYGVSATVTGRFPTGEVSELTSDGHVRVTPALAFGKSWDAGHELFVNTSLTIGSPQTAPRFAYTDAGTLAGGLGGVLNLGGSAFDLIGTVYGRMSVVDDVVGPDGARIENTARAAEALGGIRIHLPADLLLQAGGGAQLNEGLPAPDFRLFTSLHWAWIKAEPEPEPVVVPTPEPEPIPVPEPEPEPEPEPAPVVEPEPEPEPEPPAPRIVEHKIEFSESIQFETGSATIREESFNVLTQIAGVVKQYPQITKIQIEGHTDDVGNESSNKRLSEERAKSVREYMVSQGLPADRFTAVGFGESRPVASNDTDEGKAKNRRVEFVILEVNGKPVEEGQAIIQETVPVEATQEAAPAPDSEPEPEAAKPEPAAEESK